MGWEEDKHPRGHGGKFAHEAGAGGAAKDAMKVTSRRRNGDTTAAKVPGPGQATAMDREKMRPAFVADAKTGEHVSFDIPASDGGMHRHEGKVAAISTVNNGRSPKTVIKLQGSDHEHQVSPNLHAWTSKDRPPTAPGFAGSAFADPDKDHGPGGGRDVDTTAVKGKDVDLGAAGRDGRGSGYDAGPKDATFEQLQAAHDAGKKITMHHYDAAAGQWSPQGTYSLPTALDLARNATTKHGQAGKVRLTVEAAPKVAPAGAWHDHGGGHKSISIGDHQYDVRPHSAGGYTVHATPKNATMVSQIRPLGTAKNFDEAVKAVDAHASGTRPGTGGARTVRGTGVDANAPHLPLASSGDWTGDRAKTAKVRAMKAGDRIEHPTHGAGTIITMQEHAGTGRPNGWAGVKYDSGTTKSTRLADATPMAAKAIDAHADAHAAPGKPTGVRDKTERVISRDKPGGPVKDTASGGGAADRIKAGQGAGAAMAFGGREPLTKQTVAHDMKVQHISGRTGTVVDTGNRHSGLVKVKYGDGSVNSEYLGELTRDTGTAVTAGPGQHADALLKDPSGIDTLVKSMNADQARAVYAAVSAKIEAMPKQQRDSATTAVLRPLGAAVRAKKK